ncbi:MAG: hypothetical protein ABIK84_01520 [candidate division WOR-3 bacterium]
MRMGEEGERGREEKTDRGRERERGEGIGEKIREERGEGIRGGNEGRISLLYPLRMP